MDADTAPVYDVPEREVVAVEHPMIIRNIENAIKTFGKNSPFIRVSESSDPEQCIPLFLRYNDPMCVPILSHNSPTNNILLQFTVPKRTGRKRKRGSDDPFTFPDGEIAKETPEVRGPGLLGHKSSEILSQLGRDNPATLFRKINDNIDTYQVEAVAEIRQTHRYRGISDFHQATSNTKFGSKFTNLLVGGDIEKMKEFRLDPGRGWKPGEDIMPAPKMTPHTIPQNWSWKQNGNIHQRKDPKTGEQILVNASKPRKFEIPYLGFDEPSVPMESPFEIPDDPSLQELITELHQAFIDRPIWSRRALFNHLSNSRYRYLMKAAIQHAGYQFRGGPFRECVIRYGIDPRTDSQYRKYQSIFFKVFEDQRNSGMQWHDMRTTYSMTKKGAAMGPTNGHVFDGKRVTLDGKVWQLCDVTDPMLSKLIDESPLTETFEMKSDGWYMSGSMAKIRGIMRTKIMAIWRKKDITDDDFKDALEVPDHVPGRKSTQVYVPLPDDGMSVEDFAKLQQRGVPTVVEKDGVRLKVHKGKLRSARIRSRVGTQKLGYSKRAKKPYSAAAHNATPTKRGGSGAKPVAEIGAEANIEGATDPTPAETEATGLDEDGDEILEDSEPDLDSDGDEDDDGNPANIFVQNNTPSDDDAEGETDDDEDGLEGIAAPVLKNSSQANTASTGGTSSRATPHDSEPPAKKQRTSRDSASTSTPKPKRPYKRKEKAVGAPRSSTPASRRQSHTPAPTDMSAYRNIAPRPLAPAPRALAPMPPPPPT